MAETLLPPAMVPGLVTIKNKKGEMRNVYPIDAKELVYTGDWELVENGAVEAARLNANPIRSGRAAGIPHDNIIVEVAGGTGAVVAHADADEAERIRESSAGAEGTGPDPKAPKANAREADSDAATKSAAQPKTEAEKSDTKAGAKESDKK